MSEIDDFDESAAPPVDLMVGREFSFSGKPLAPYSFARKIVFQNLREKNEDPVPEFFTVALIFILMADQATVTRWIFNAKQARGEIMAWLESFDERKYSEAVNVASEILTRAKNRVDIVPAAGAEKKNLAPCEEILVCGTLAREYHEPFDRIFWEWPVGKCLALWHLYLYHAQVTCTPALDTEEILRSLAN